MAYEPRIASALSGVTQGQLTYWRRTAAFMPEISMRPALYSFRDLMALRTFAILRGSRSLQKIRKALGTLKEIGESAHLSSYSLAVQGKRGIVLIREDGTEGVELVEKPGNLVTVVKLGDVFKSFPLDDIEVPNLLRPREFIAVDPEVRGGHPVVAGTRVPFDLVAGLVNDGVEPEEIAEFYPSVTASAARDAADFAKYVDRAAQRKLRSAA
jgi:uncharacterized protein (DUF433 family)